ITDQTTNTSAPTSITEQTTTTNAPTSSTELTTTTSASTSSTEQTTATSSEPTSNTEQTTTTSAPASSTEITTTTSAPTSSTEPTTTTSAPTSSTEPATTTTCTNIERRPNHSYNAPAFITDPTTTTSTDATPSSSTTEKTSSLSSTDSTQSSATSGTTPDNSIKYYDRDNSIHYYSRDNSICFHNVDNTILYNNGDNAINNYNGENSFRYFNGDNSTTYYVSRHYYYNYCGSPPAPGNGSVIKPNSTLFGNVARQICNEGYIGSGNIVCLYDGWTPGINCTLRDCGEAPSIPSGNVTLTIDRTTYGSTASVTCREGYTITGNHVIECEASGIWSVPGSCNKIDCGIPPTISNAKVTYASTLLDDTATVQCDLGYSIKGSSDTMFCDNNGNWTSGLSCIPNAHAKIEEAAREQDHNILDDFKADGVAPDAA
ncbi:uncharacterized protein LOC127870742, partial [Dreissena polymorpha]|uniref:uncharacterized protein LOC127870742 n=1 Tax=Dreissena polymorpha TaxID=45954 RepID=UPI00226440B7